ncbi:MAG: cytochrome c [Pseudomonadales bacterium]
MNIVQVLSSTVKRNRIVSAALAALLTSVSLPALAGDAAAGKDVAAPCAACHGSDGNSVAPNWPKLAGLGERYMLKQLNDIKSGARSIPEMMGQLDNMSGEDLENLAAYYASQTMSGGVAKAELVAEGESIYRGGVKDSGISACTACHSPTGKGNVLAGFPRLSGQHATYIEAQLLKFQTTDRNNDSESVMRDIAKRMTAAEIKAVSSYASGLR